MSSFLEYANKTQSNIIPKESFEELVHEVFGVLSSNLSRSLGPLGSNTTILDGMMTDGTKDGFTIFKSYRFHNRYKNMIYNLMKAPCTALNNTVGDGTTTAIVMSGHLFSEYQRNKRTLDTLYRLPRQFTKAWDGIIQTIVEKIESYSTPLDPDDYDTIYNIAYVVSNGNEEISRNFADTYKVAKSPVIKMKNSPTNKSYITPITGFEFPANLISDAYARTEDLSVTLKDICVMVFDHKIELDMCTKFIIPINEILKAQGKKLLVLAPFYDAYLVETHLQQYLNHEFQKYRELNLLMAQYEIGKLADHQLDDLATVLRTKVINQEMAMILMEQFSNISETSQYDLIDECVNGSGQSFISDLYRRIGIAATAYLSCTNGSIFKIEGIESDDSYNDSLRAAEAELKNLIATTDREKQSYTFKISKAQARVSQLKMENYIYYIGADSALQHRIIEDAVEDVTKCIRSAVKSGIVPGCQLSIIKACAEIIGELNPSNEESDDTEPSDAVKLKMSILEIISNAVIQTYARVLHGPDGYGMVKLVDMWNYIDPTNEDAIKELNKKAIDKGIEIMKESISKNQVFDLETLEFSDKIITSAETDIMVLVASSELVKLLISGNQCVFLDSEVNDNHNDTVQVYT